MHKVSKLTPAVSALFSCGMNYKDDPRRQAEEYLEAYKNLPPEAVNTIDDVRAIEFFLERYVAFLAEAREREKIRQAAE